MLRLIVFGEVKRAEWMAHKNVKFVVCLSLNTYRKKTGGAEEHLGNAVSSDEG